MCGKPLRLQSCSKIARGHQWKWESIIRMNLPPDNSIRCTSALAGIGHLACSAEKDLGHLKVPLRYFYRLLSPWKRRTSPLTCSYKLATPPPEPESVIS